MNAPDAVAAIRAAADNTALVMPPLAAKHLRRDLLAAASAISATSDELAQLLAEHWADRVDEINAYADRVHTEYEVFLDGSSPDDATVTAPAETREAALTADGWFVDAGVAHRPVIQLHGLWVIDRPAANTIKESAA